MKAIFFIFLTVILVSCKKTEVIKNDTYTIYEISNHKSTYSVEKVKSNRIEGKAFFDSSCEYKLTDNVGQINKLIGLSSGTYHHQNSIRIGWEYMEGEGFYKLFAYYYIDSKREEKYLTKVFTDEVFVFTVEISDENFYVKVNDVDFSIPHLIKEPKDSYMLYPYFGGKEPFPNSIHGDTSCRVYIKL